MVRPPSKKGDPERARVWFFKWPKENETGKITTPNCNPQYNFLFKYENPYLMPVKWISFPDQSLTKFHLLLTLGKKTKSLVCVNIMIVQPHKKSDIPWENHNSWKGKQQRNLHRDSSSLQTEELGTWSTLHYCEWWMKILQDKRLQKQQMKWQVNHKNKDKWEIMHSLSPGASPIGYSTMNAVYLAKAEVIEYI